MITSAQLIKKYGDPRINTAVWESKNMTMYDVPLSVEQSNPVMPKRIYCHRDFAATLNAWFNAMAESTLIHEIKTWDGCFNIRTKRGASSLSMHAFGMAIDINAAHNPFRTSREQAVAKGLKPFSPMFIDLARKFVDCGMDWNPSDGMHFQVKTLVP